MAALVCDICGGKLIMGAGEIAVCYSCGTMHSADRMKEKIQEVRGIVQVDNSHMLENYFEIAQNAQATGNNSEAELYCNKMIEIDSSDYRAWMLKGKAIIWESSLQNNRTNEGVASMIKAINKAPDDVKEALIEEAKEQIKGVSLALISIRRDRFVKWPDEEETKGFSSDIASIFNTVTNFQSQTGETIPLSEITTPIATMINDAAAEAWNNLILPEYVGDDDGFGDRAGKDEWDKFLKRAGYCTELLEKAISLCDEDDESDIIRYKSLISVHKAVIDSCSWVYEITSSGKEWYRDWVLTDEAKDARRELIRSYEAKIKKIEESKKKAEEKEAKKRFDEYWSEHSAEKAALETERAALQGEITSLQSEINDFPGPEDIKSIQERIDALDAEKRSLGIFKGKERKELQEKMDAAHIELKKVTGKMDVAKNETKEMEEKIDSLQKRIAEIDAELTKAR